MLYMENTEQWGHGLTSMDCSIGPSNREKWSTFQAFPVPPNRLNFRPKFPVILVEWITTTVFNRWFTGMATKQEELSIFELAMPNYSMNRSLWQKLQTLKQDLNNARQEKSAIEEITKTLNEVHFKIKMQTHSNCMKNKNDHNSRI